MLFITSRILIVDDEESIVNMLKLILKKEGFTEIESTNSGLEAIDLVEKNTYDLILLDVMLPDKNGFEICPLIRQKTDASIFFLTAKISDLDKLSGFAYGADDYITKPFNPLELIARIRVHLKRNLQRDLQKSTPMTVYKKTPFSYSHFTINPDSAELTVDRKATYCSAQVFQLLLFFCKNPNQVFAKETLYERVWGENSFNEDNTVTVHIRKIREKIEVNPSKPKYIITVRGIGYKFVPDKADS